MRACEVGWCVCIMCNEFVLLPVESLPPAMLDTFCERWSVCCGGGNSGCDTALLPREDSPEYCASTEMILALICTQTFYGPFFTRAIPKGLTFGYMFKILCIKL